MDWYERHFFVIRARIYESRTRISLIELPSQMKRTICFVVLISVSQNIGGGVSYTARKKFDNSDAENSGGKSRTLFVVPMNETKRSLKIVNRDLFSRILSQNLSIRRLFRKIIRNFRKAKLNHNSHSRKSDHRQFWRSKFWTLSADPDGNLADVCFPFIDIDSPNRTYDWDYVHNAHAHDPLPGVSVCDKLGFSYYQSAIETKIKS